jgi:hypothetical protein
MAQPLAIYKSLILGDLVETGPTFQIQQSSPEVVQTLGADRSTFNEPGASASLEIQLDVGLVRGKLGEIPGETFQAFELRRLDFALSLLAAVGRGSNFTARGPLVWVFDRDTEWTTLDTTAAASGSPTVLDLKKTIGLSVGNYIYLANRTTGQTHYTTVTAVSGTDTTIASMPWTGTFNTTLVAKPLWILADVLIQDLPSLETGPGTLGGNVDLSFTFVAAATSPIKQT